MRLMRAAVATVLSAAVLFPSGGCILAADAINPGLFSALGFDPQLIFPPRGTLIVVFRNDTQSPALFSAFETSDLNDLTLDTRNFSVTVDPGASRNEVLECPIGAISPGLVGGEGEDLEIDAANAGIVFDEGAGTAVAYGGSVLQSGQDYACGDVILVTLQQFGADYGFTVQVIKGR